MPDARCTRSLACKIKKHTSVVTTGSPDSSGIPRAMVLTVSFVISPVIGLCCHRRQRNYFRQLERQHRAVRTTRLRRPHQRVSSSALTTSTASRPAFVTIANRPLCGTGPDRFIPVSTNRSSLISENQKLVGTPLPPFKWMTKWLSRRRQFPCSPWSPGHLCFVDPQKSAHRVRLCAAGRIATTRRKEVRTDRPALPHRDHPCKRCRHRCRPSRGRSRRGL
jgi:hypothetical protein